MTGLLAIVADLGAIGAAVSSGRATAVSVEAATVTATVASAVSGSAVLGGVVLLRLLGELDGDARAREI